MIYKTLKKVSDVCQLLDKRKYPATQTIVGVTFTNNGDGSITANGNCTYIYNLNITEIDKFTIKAEHKYLILDSSGATSRNQYSTWVRSGRGAILLDSVSTPIGSLGYNDNKCTVFIRINKGVSISNITFKPQLFDLTEMYGVGNEPTTVEQFRQDFPEELYDYKPYCFVKSYKTLLKVSDDKIITSYKKSLVCKTKNLFDISKVKETDTLKIIGNSIYSYTYPAATEEASTLSIFKSLKPDTNYTMSAVCPFYLGAATNWILIVFNNGDTIVVFENYKSGFAQRTFSLTQEQIDNITYVYFYGKLESEGGPIIWSNIQIEEGNTATEYHPYGYL